MTPARCCAWSPCGGPLPRTSEWRSRTRPSAARPGPGAAWWEGWGGGGGRSWGGCAGGVRGVPGVGGGAGMGVRQVGGVGWGSGAELVWGGAAGWRFSRHRRICGRICALLLSQSVTVLALTQQLWTCAGVDRIMGMVPAGRGCWWLPVANALPGCCCVLVVFLRPMGSWVRHAHAPPGSTPMRGACDCCACPPSCRP